MLKQLIVSCGVLIWAGNTLAAPIRVSVHQFRDKSGDSQCRYRDHWWYRNLGEAFQEMLISELAKKSGIEILERQTIREVYDDEHELLNSGKVDKPQKEQFKVAHYVINGAVSDFEYCDSDTRGGVDVGHLMGIGSLKVGGAHGTAKVGVDLRVIDVKTGVVVQTLHGEGKAKATALKVSSDITGEDSQIGHTKNAPITQAARSAIADAVAKLALKQPG